jgi:hypothetical protein
VSVDLEHASRLTNLCVLQTGKMDVSEDSIDDRQDELDVPIDLDDTVDAGDWDETDGLIPVEASGLWENFKRTDELFPVHQLLIMNLLTIAAENMTSFKPDPQKIFNSMKNAMEQNATTLLVCLGNRKKMEVSDLLLLVAAAKLSGIKNDRAVLRAVNMLLSRNFSSYRCINLLEIGEEKEYRKKIHELFLSKWISRIASIVKDEQVVDAAP